MKKTLVALAALAATGAFAQSTVSIQGIMDANISSGKSYGQSYSLIGQSGARTTSVRFHGTEDMGKGLKANFRFEVQPLLVAGDGNGFNNRLDVAAGAISANGSASATGQASAQSGLAGKGYSFVGVSGSFGEVQFGTINTASVAAYLNGSGAFGTGVGSAYGVIQGSTATNTFTRFENSVAYMTPSFNGFSARFQTMLGNDSSYGSSSSGVTLRRSDMQELGLSYAAGPLTVNVAQLQVKTSPNEATSTAATALASASNVTTKTTTASVGYNLGVARLGAGISNIKNNGGLVGDSSATGATDTKSYLLTATVPMGAARLMASVGERKTNAAVATALEGKKTTFMGLAAEYDLSKRTYVYARYQSGKAGDVNARTTVINGAAASSTDAQLSNTKFNLMAVGVSHAF